MARRVCANASHPGVTPPWHDPGTLVPGTDGVWDRNPAGAALPSLLQQHASTHSFGKRSPCTWTWLSPLSTSGTVPSPYRFI